MNTWKNFKPMRAATVALMSLLIAACGGGGSGGATGPTIGGINGGGIAQGPVTGFGSIFVNGVEFSTSGATIRVEDSTATESQLKLGQVVVVRGTINSDGRTGTATSVSFNDNLEGPIASIDAANNTFVVLGQTVRITGTTVFDSTISPASIAGLAAGQVVEVSGAPGSTGIVSATRIERKAAGGTFEVTGAVSNLDTNASRFNIGTLTIAYAGVTPTNGSLANGGCAEAKGSVVSGNVLTATSVEVKSCGVSGNNNDKGEIEGLITRFASLADFDVGSTKITATGATTILNGTSADLRVDLKVEVEGTFNASGVLSATKIEIKPETSSRLLGLVENVSSTANTITIFGVTINTSAAATTFEDKSNARLSPFRIGDVRTGDYLEVRGFQGTVANAITGVRVERNDLNSRRELQGKVASVARPSLTILGVTVSTDGATQYRDESGAAITADTFFGAAANRIVKVRGSGSGTAFAASEAELQND